MAFHKVIFAVITVAFLLQSVTSLPSTNIQQRQKNGQLLRSASFSYNQNGIAADVLQKATNGEANYRFKYGGPSQLTTWLKTAASFLNMRRPSAANSSPTSASSNLTSTINDGIASNVTSSNVSIDTNTRNDNVTVTSVSTGVTSTGIGGNNVITVMSTDVTIPTGNETDDVTVVTTTSPTAPAAWGVTSTTGLSIVRASDRVDVDIPEGDGATGSDATVISGDRRRDAGNQKPEAPSGKNRQVFKIPEFPAQDSQKIAQSLKGVDNSELFRSLYETQPDAPRYANPEREVPLNVFGLPPKYRYRHPVGNVEAMEPPRVRTNDDLPGPVVDHAVRRGSGWRNDDNKFARLYDLHPDTRGFAKPDKEVPLNIFGLPPKFRYPHPFGHVNGSPPNVVHTNAFLSGPVTDVIEDLPKLSMHLSAHPATHADGYDKQGDRSNHQYSHSGHQQPANNLHTSQSQLQPQLLPPPSHHHHHPQRPLEPIPAADRVIHVEGENKPFEIPRHLPSALRDQMESIFKGIRDAVANVQSNLRADETGNRDQTEMSPETESEPHSPRFGLANFPNLQPPIEIHSTPTTNNKEPREISQLFPEQAVIPKLEIKQADTSGPSSETMQTQQSIQSHQFQPSPSDSNHPFAKYSQGPIRYVNPQLIEPIKVSNIHPAEIASNFDLAKALESMLSSSSSLQAGGYYGNKLRAVNQLQAFNKHHSKQLLPDVTASRFKYSDPHQTDDVFTAGPVQQWLNQHGISTKPNTPSVGNLSEAYGKRIATSSSLTDFGRNNGKSLKATLLQALSNMMAMTKNRQQNCAFRGQPSKHDQEMMPELEDTINPNPNDRTTNDDREKHPQHIVNDGGVTSARQPHGRQLIYRRPPLDHNKIKLHHVIPQYNGGSAEGPTTEEYIFKAHDDTYKKQNDGGHDSLKYHHGDKDQYGADASPATNVNTYGQNGDGSHFVSHQPTAALPNTTPVKPHPPTDYQPDPVSTQQHIYQQTPHRQPHQFDSYIQQQNHHQYDRPRHPPHVYHHPKPRPPPPHLPQHNNYGYQRPRGILEMLFPKLFHLGVNLGLTKELIFQKSDRRQGYGEPPPLPKITLRLGLKKNIDARLTL